MLHGRLLPLSALFVLFFAAAGRGVAAPPSGQLLPGFQRSPRFEKQVAKETTPTGVRLLFNASALQQFDSRRPTRLLFYATPNGNTIEQTMGSALAPGTDWHFDMQHIAAQTRRLRELDTQENVVLVCVEAAGESWPAWRRKHADNAALIRGLAERRTNASPALPSVSRWQGTAVAAASCLAF